MSEKESTRATFFMGNTAAVVSNVQPPQTEQSDFPRWGVKLSYYEQFLEQFGGAKSLARLSSKEFVELKLKPELFDKKTSYCEFLRFKGCDAVGVATVYVVHAWSQKFIDTIEALRNHFCNTPDVVVWIDLLSVNQFDGLSPEKLSLDGFQQMVIVMDPLEPVALKRSWCLWEILRSVQASIPVELALTATQLATVSEDLATGKRAISCMTKNVDFHLSQASEEYDRKFIISLVEDSVGVQRYNAVIVNLMQDCLIKLIVRATRARNVEARFCLRLHTTLAEVYTAQGRYTSAENTYLDCLMESTVLLGPHHASTLHLFHVLADLFEKDGHKDWMDTMEVLYLEGFKADISFRGSRLTDETHSMRGASDKERRHPRRLGGEEDGDEPHGWIANPSMLQKLAQVYHAMQHYEQAEALMYKAIQAHSRHLRDDHPDLLVALDTLAVMYMGQGQYSEAEPLLVQSFAKKSQCLAADHPTALHSLHQLASVYILQHKFPEAEALLQRGLDQLQAITGPDHPEAIRLQHVLASLHARQRRWVVAEDMLTACCRRAEKALGAQDPRTLAAMNNLAVVYFQQGRLPQAESLLVTCLARRRAVSGDTHPDTLDVVGNLAGVYAALAAQPKK